MNPELVYKLQNNIKESQKLAQTIFKEFREPFDSDLTGEMFPQQHNLLYLIKTEIALLERDVNAIEEKVINLKTKNQLS